MPSRPSKRSKVSSKGGGSSKLTELATEVTVATLRHKRGIAALPSELLLEIVSYFTEISIADIRRNPRTLPVEYRERFSTLKALSQTCKDLRSVCLPLAWERLEACTTAGPSHMFYREVGVTLERKCSGLLKSKHLLSYIRIVTVTLTRYESATIIPIFAKCLAALPNLHTIQVVHAYSQMTTAIKNGFAGIVLRGVRTVILPSCTHEILRCCPEVESLTCNENVGSKLVGALVATKCTKLKALRGIFTNKDQAKRIAKVAPNLRLVECIGNWTTALDADYIGDLTGSFANLGTIEIRFSPEDPDTGNTETHKLVFVKAARAVLQKSKYDGQKTIVFRYMRRLDTIPHDQGAGEEEHSTEVIML